MALLYRYSPTYPGSSSRRATRTPASEPSLRPCVSCSLTCLAPSLIPSGAPADPPPYASTPPSSPSSPAFTISSLPSSNSEYEWRSHDHPTIFVRCAGHVASLPNKKPTTTFRGPGNGGAVEAGIGVSFGSTSRYDISEPIPSTVTAGDHGMKRMAITPNRAEIFAAVRALDRVKSVLTACVRDRSEGGWDGYLGAMIGISEKKRLAPGVTLPGKVEEVVVLTRSEYVISSITAREADKPWRTTPEGKRRFATPVPSGRRGRNASLDSLSSTLSRDSSSSTKNGGGQKRVWLTRKGTKARKTDFDLFFELDLLVEELAERYGVRVCFHKAVVGEATKLAKKGASREEEEH